MIAWLTFAALFAADPPPEKTGPEIGSVPATFALKDQAATERKLADLLAEREFTAIVFHRSANW
jgi:hypothetical protein